jgi:hypothetical protein
MEARGPLAPAFTQAQHLLEPFIKSRQETTHIRRVLAGYLESLVNQQNASPRSGPLSLQDGSMDVKPLPNTVRGLRKEYLKCLRANVKARQEYDRLKNLHLLGTTTYTSKSSNNSGHLDDYIAVIRQRQRQERLRILQNYIDSFAQKSRTILPYLEGSETTFGTLPRVPAEVANPVRFTSEGSAGPDLGNLVYDLERSVLKAKVLLKNEQQALSQAQSGMSNRRASRTNTATADQQKLQALSQTRNELISWVEEELGKAGEEGSGDDGGNSVSQFSTSVEDQLVFVKSQYNSYIEARRGFLVAVSESNTSSPNPSEQVIEVATQNESIYTTSVLLPFLEDLLTISNEQKSLIQQRSHLTVSLAKQHKETIHTFDRLADESHLLPAFPMPGSQSSRVDYGTSTTFSEEMARKEAPNVSERARAWIFAATSAAMKTKDVVIEQVEEGTIAVDEARQSIAAIDSILRRRQIQGNSDGKQDDIWMESMPGSKLTPPSSSGNVGEKAIDVVELWSLLDGKLGVIRRTAAP